MRRTSSRQYYLDRVIRDRSLRLHLSRKSGTPSAENGMQFFVYGFAPLELV